MSRQCGGGGTSAALGVPVTSQSQLCLHTGSPICGSAAQAGIALRLVFNYGRHVVDSRRKLTQREEKFSA